MDMRSTINGNQALSDLDRVIILHRFSLRSASMSLPNDSSVIQPNLLFSVLIESSSLPLDLDPDQVKSV